MTRKTVKSCTFYTLTSNQFCRVVSENGLASEKNTAGIIGVDSSCNTIGAHAIKPLMWNAMGHRVTSVYVVDLIIFKIKKRRRKKRSVILVYAPRIAERESSNFPLPPLALAWLPSNETLPKKLSSLPSASIAPVAIDRIKGTKQERLIRSSYSQLAFEFRRVISFMTARPLDHSSTTVDASDLDSVSINVRDVSCEKRSPSEMPKVKT